MGFVAIGAAVAGAAVSGFFSSRAAKKQAKAQKKAAELQSRTTMYLDAQRRKYQLEDRRHKEQAGGMYRQFYGGGQPVMAPALTDPGPGGVDPFKKVG